jgi:hypothetical protein
MSKKINKKEKIMSVKSIIIFFVVGVIVILRGILVFSNIQNKPSSNIPNKLSSNIPNKFLLKPQDSVIRRRMGFWNS